MLRSYTWTWYISGMSRLYSRIFGPTKSAGRPKYISQFPDAFNVVCNRAKKKGSEYCYLKRLNNFKRKPHMDLQPLDMFRSSCPFIDIGVLSTWKPYTQQNGDMKKQQKEWWIGSRRVNVPAELQAEKQNDPERMKGSEIRVQTKWMNTWTNELLIP
jgi:hypothetical protein